MSERKRQRDYLVAVRYAMTNRHTVFAILDESEGAEQAIASLMSSLGVDEVGARGILNVRLEQFTGSRRREIDESLRRLSDEGDS
jgi:DNA gyrase/topoisomerase IV subunit A